MLYVALAEAVVVVVLVIAFAGLFKSLSRDHARRENLLLNQLLHAVDRPWQPAPADLAAGNGHRDDDDPEPSYRLWTTSPEQEI